MPLARTPTQIHPLYLLLALVADTKPLPPQRAGQIAETLTDIDASELWIGDLLNIGSQCAELSNGGFVRRVGQGWEITEQGCDLLDDIASIDIDGEESWWNAAERLAADRTGGAR